MTSATTARLFKAFGTCAVTFAAASAGALVWASPAAAAPICKTVPGIHTPDYDIAPTNICAPNPADVVERSQICKDTPTIYVDSSYRIEGIHICV